MFPTLFISHGSPMLALTDSPARSFLQNLGPALGRPRAILVASAHWETRTPLASAPAQNPTIHDFRGFPAALYQLHYPAPGDPDLAARVTGLLDGAGLHGATDPVRGLDHGAWVPLMLMYPDHDIPVIQLSIQSALGPAHHLKLGQAIEKLRADNILVIGSGSFTHDLSRFRGQALDAPETPDVAAFADWFDRALTEGRTEDLLSYRTLAPHAAEEHPTEEHLLPIYVALGAAGPGAKAERLHSSTNYAILRMDAYAFH